MADGINRVILLGNLGADPESKVTAGGQAILKMRMATAETYLDKNKVRQEKTEWHSITVFGKRAEVLSRFLTKGSKLLVEGSLHTSSYDDRDGNKRYRTEVVANNIVLCGGRGEGRSEGGRQERPAQTEHDAAKSNGYSDDDYGQGDDSIPFD